MVYLIWSGMFLLFCAAVLNAEHGYHNQIRRGFGLKRETLADRWKKRRDRP